MTGHINAAASPRLQTAIRLLLGITAATALCGTSLAQDAADPAAKAAAGSVVDEVIVTGSRISGVAPVGSSVNTIGREDIDISAAVTTAQLLQEIPQVYNLGISENSRGQSGGSGNITYGTAINLRGLSPYATLTILDGHRAVPQGTTGQAIDPSIIPTLALERVEVVADGASAIYGSDAVAGVVNLILRRNFDGMQANVRYGMGDEYDERKIGAVFGHTWDSGQFMAAFENGYHSSLSGRDRDFFRGDLSAEGGGDFRTVQCNPGNIVVGGVSYAIPEGGVTPANQAALVPGTVNRCDNAKAQDLLPEQNHNSFAFTFDQELTDSISLFADGFYARRDFENATATPGAALTVRNTNAWFVSPPGTTPATQTVNYSFDDGQLPPNSTEGHSKAWEATLGSRFRLPGEWKMELLYTFGRDDDESISTHGINNAALAAALASSDPATALDPFGLNRTNPAVLEGIANQLFYAPGRTLFNGYELRFDGRLFQLPGGDVRVAFGYEGQRLENRAGLTTGTLAAPVATRNNVERKVNSVYAEVLIPIVSDANALPAIRDLTLNVAGRYDDYSDVGSTTNPKYGLNWSPIDGLTLRGSYGESFRAPLFSQLYGNSSLLYVQNYSDPTRGGALTTGLTLSGGNLDLQPETAKTYSFGVDYEPEFLPGARLSLTWFKIEYELQVTSYLSDLTILNRESQFDGTGIITRDPSPELVAQLLGQYAVRGVPPNPVTLFVDGRTNNLGTTVAKGVDLQARYQWSTGLGQFAAAVNGEYMTDYDVAITPTAPLVDQLNTIYNPLRFKGRGSLYWSGQNFSAAGFVNYQSSYDNNLAAQVQKVDSHTTLDARVAYGFENQGWLSGVTVALDVVNAFDTEPEFVNIAQSPNGGGGFDATLNNPVGRIISLSIDKKW